MRSTHMSSWAVLSGIRLRVLWRMTVHKGNDSFHSRVLELLQLGGSIMLLRLHSARSGASQPGWKTPCVRTAECRPE